MALTLHAMAGSASLAAVGAWGATAYFRPKVRLAPLPLSPRALVIARLHLHRVDVVAFVFAAGGIFSLLPETIQAFAPELMRGTNLAGGALEHLDYVAFVLVSLSFGMGLARRLLLIALEKASLQPCP
ncbi:hypothetical protein [Bosea sp. (in: a-proteobacteria)]|uniref:hypothetical protein n=1 Tax=Bosea sp. (in: a-proteobacteria) TaxID=1871050 RepID=UPI002FC8693A